MSLSSNWKTLSSKISPEQAKKTKVKKPQRTKKYQSKDVSKLRKAEVVPPASTKLLTPLEFALWTSASNSTLKVPSGSSKKSVDYSDGRKLAPGKYLAIDCEFVGVGPNDISALARVSIVNYFGVVLLDTYVKPEGRVTNWRTWVSGITPQHMRGAISFKEAQEKVKGIVTDRIVVGHAVRNDFDCLGISVPKHLIRDTASLRRLNGGKVPSLKKLCLVHLGIDIQSGSHSSVEDAQATMAIFRLHQKAIESRFSR